MEAGDAITVTPKDGSGAYEGVVRGVHEGGFTLWMDEEAKEEGEVRTVNAADVDVSVEKPSKIDATKPGKHEAKKKKR